MSLRSTLKAMQEQTENHLLVHWSEEECASVVTISSIIGPPVVGKAGQVRVGKMVYEGTIIKIGAFVYYNNKFTMNHPANHHVAEPFLFISRSQLCLQSTSLIPSPDFPRSDFQS